MAVVTLKKGEGRLLKSGGMWVFDNEIDTIMGSFTNGDMVLISDGKRLYQHKFKNHSAPDDQR